MKSRMKRNRVRRNKMRKLSKFHSQWDKNLHTPLEATLPYYIA